MFCRKKFHTSVWRFDDSEIFLFLLWKSLLKVIITRTSWDFQTTSKYLILSFFGRKSLPGLIVVRSRWEFIPQLFYFVLIFFCFQKKNQIFHTRLIDKLILVKNLNKYFAIYLFTFSNENFSTDQFSYDLSIFSFPTPSPAPHLSGVCEFITAVPITKLFAWGEGGGGEWRTCATRDYEPRPVWTSLPIAH